MSISKIRYFICPTCGTVFNKEQALNMWPMASMFSSSTISGTRTCNCGKIFQVQDIYDGTYDLPKQYWDQMDLPATID